MNNPKINELTRANPIGVVSTTSLNGVDSAAVYYMIDADGTIFFNCRRDSQKFKNIQADPRVAFAVFQKDPDMTLQAKGTAEVVTDIGTMAETYSALLKRVFAAGATPPILNIGISEVELIKITPTWMRLGSFTHEKKSDMFTTIIGTETQR